MRSDANTPERVSAALARAAARPDHWPDVFDLLGEALGGVGALLEVYDRQGVLGVIGPHAPFFDDALIKSYITDYQSLSPRPSALAGAQLPTVQYDAQLGTEQELDRNPFYADFLPKQGLRYFVSTTLPFADGLRGVVSVQRTPQAGHVGEDEIALLQRLRPALQGMIEPSLGSLFDCGRADALSAALPHLAPNGLVLSMTGDVLEVGSVVQSLLPLKRRNGPSGRGLRLVSPILAALRDGGQQSLRTGANVSIDLSAHTAGTVLMADVRALASPWGQPLRRRVGATAGMVVLAVSLSTVHADPQVALRERYGLTMRESEVLLALADGLSPKDIAERMDMSLVTVRSHLARLREKTECQSAAQLVSLVLHHHKAAQESRHLH